MVFAPCFFLGHYAGSCFARGFVKGLVKRRRLWLPILTAAVLLYELLLLGQKPSPELLYGAASYDKAGGGPWLRLLLLSSKPVCRLFRLKG